jgi:hypothetical protein
MTELITEVTFLPDGMALDDYNAHIFAVRVEWRGATTDTGRGGYAVVHGSKHLSRKGDWRWNPEPFIQRHYRWEDIDEARAVARSVVNTIKVNGKTWAEHEAAK